MSALYAVVTSPGTECSTNALTLTLNCGTCVAGDSWDAEWLIYEYSNAVQLTNTGFALSGGPGVSTLNAPITTDTSGDAIMGCAVLASGIRPASYGSGQTNQHTWLNNGGYPCGDLEGLSTGSSPSWPVESSSQS